MESVGNFVKMHSKTLKKIYKVFLKLQSYISDVM